ncbi:hypothetical protein [Sphingobium sp. AS12]|nr:hypothetical protein [Sphingobium sp. AS12]
MMVLPVDEASDHFPVKGTVKIAGVNAKRNSFASLRLDRRKP